MANNPYVNKVVYGNNTVMDISDTTAEEADVASGAVFYKASGARSVGTGSTGGGTWGSITGTLSDQTDLQDALDEKMSYADNGVLGAKNLLYYPYYSPSSSFFTVNNDGTITMNGTASERAVFTLIHRTVPHNPPKGKYILSKGFSSTSIGQDVGIIVEAYNDNTWVKVLATSAGTDEIEFDIDYNGYNKINVYLYASVGSYSNVIVKPMLRLASDPDDTYVPYAQTNKELTDSKMSYADNGILGAKNLLSQKDFTSETINGITFTKLDEGRININGTNSGSASYFNVNPNYTLSAGNYILSKGFSNDDVRLSVDAYNGNTWVRNLVTLGTAQEHEFTVDYNNYDAIRVQIIVQPNKSVSNVVAYPMIRLATDTDDTYAPYAMTNKELTDAVGDAVISLTKAEYDALPSTDKNDPDKVYYVTDYDPDDDSTVVQVPSFYVELSVAPTEQTPIVVPDGTLSKPFRLILKNVGSSNITIGAGSSAVFMKEQTSATVKSIYTTYRISSYSYYSGSTSVRIYPASSTSQTYPSIVDLTYDPKVEKLIFAYTKTYNEYDFLSVKQKGSEIDSSDAVDIYTSTNESIIIFAREYTKGTGVYRGHHAYFVFTPDVANPVPQSVSMGASSNTGISITFANEDESTGKVTIKASSSTYYVDYTAYRVCN